MLLIVYFFSFVRVLIAEHFRLFRVDLQTHLLGAWLEVAHLSLQLLQRCREQDNVVAESQVCEGI